MIRSAYLIPGLFYDEQELIKDICKHFDVNIEDVIRAETKGSRKRNLVLARQVSMVFICDFFSHKTLTEVGDIFNRDHTTVVHARKTIEDLCITNNNFKKMIENLSNTVKNKIRS